MSKAFDKDGNEIDVFTTEEAQAQVVAEGERVRGEFAPIIKGLEGKVTEVTTALNERTGEFKQFRKLNDEAVAKLSVAERTIYENGLLLQEEREKSAAGEKARQEAARDNAIRAKVGTDEKLFGKVKDMYALIGIQATTPEEIDRKVLATLGAISQTEPDLVASVAGFTGGSFKPPEEKKAEDGSFADTDKGKAAMSELGLRIPEVKK